MQCKGTEHVYLPRRRAVAAAGEAVPVRAAPAHDHLQRGRGRGNHGPGRGRLHLCRQFPRAHHFQRPPPSGIHEAPAAAVNDAQQGTPHVSSSLPLCSVSHGACQFTSLHCHVSVLNMKYLNQIWLGLELEDMRDGPNSKMAE